MHDKEQSGKQENAGLGYQFITLDLFAQTTI